MNMTHDKASKLIAGVLSELEKDTGSVVTRVRIEDIETRTINDDRSRLLRHVQIELERVPGTNWAK